MGKIHAVCISEQKGTEKHPIEEGILRVDHGLVGDAHAGNWHRQISLLGLEEIEAFRAKGADVAFGAFGENLVVSGFDLKALPVGTRLVIGDAELEVSQIGKACHSHCAIFHQVGDCIMPREGIFAKVVRPGTVKAGDEITMVPAALDRPFTAAVIVLSDRSFAGEREDKSGPEAVRLLTEAGYEIVESLLLPDGEQPLKKEMIRLADQRQVNVIFTSGGTGFSVRDVTPEATIAVCERMAPGIAEAVRAYSMTLTPKAMLSRAVSGIRGRSLIINLPGSPKAVRETLEFLLPTLGHGIGILRGTDDN